MPLEEFLDALSQAGVRPAFESAEACDAFWEDLEDRTRPQMVEYERAHRESEALAFREWRN
jgi:hypothetical protein